LFIKRYARPGDADYYFHLTGKEMNNRNTNFSFGYYSKPGVWDTSAPGGMTHPFNQCLVFAAWNRKIPIISEAKSKSRLGKIMKGM